MLDWSKDNLPANLHGDVQADADRQGEEAALIARAKLGDQAAIAALYRHYAARLYRLVLYPKLGQREAAEDALSDTFRTMIEKLHTYEDQGKTLWPWLARIANNKAMDQHRRRGSARRALANFEQLLVPLRVETQTFVSPLEEEQERTRLAKEIDLVMTNLNPRYQKVIELRLRQGRSREECAKDFGVTIATFDVLLLRALRAFRKGWEHRRESEEENK